MCAYTCIYVFVYPFMYVSIHTYVALVVALFEELEQQPRYGIQALAGLRRCSRGPSAPLCAGLPRPLGMSASPELFCQLSPARPSSRMLLLGPGSIRPFKSGGRVPNFTKLAVKIQMYRAKITAGWLMLGGVGM